MLCVHFRSEVVAPIAVLTDHPQISAVPKSQVMDASMTAIVRTTESEPTALVAVIVKAVEGDLLGGEPVIIPVLVSKVSPVGSSGLTENDVGVPLVTTGVLGAILASFA